MGRPARAAPVPVPDRRNELTDVVVRLVIALGALGAGGGAGLLLRHRRRTPHLSGNGRLQPGIYLVSAPFCTRCASVRLQLEALSAPFTVIDARDDRTRVAELDIRTAPTLLVVDAAGGIIDAECEDFSNQRLATIARLRRGQRRNGCDEASAS